MENVTDALIMAGCVLIFIIALSVCISSFSTLRVGIDDVVGQTETVEMARDSTGYINYIEAKNDGAIRIVGSETVVSSMYRAIKEDYTIYLKLNNSTLIKEIEEKGFDVYKTTSDLKDTNGNNLIAAGTIILKITISTPGNSSISNVNELMDTKVPTNRFYQEISEKTFYEYLGEYQNNTDVSSENKQTKRIITYIEKN